MTTTGNLHRYGQNIVSDTLKELIELKCIEKIEDGYCLFGARDNKEQVVREIREYQLKEERQHADYQAECDHTEALIQAEIRPHIDSLSQEHLKMDELL